MAETKSTFPKMLAEFAVFGHLSLSTFFLRLLASLPLVLPFLYKKKAVTFRKDQPEEPLRSNVKFLKRKKIGCHLCVRL
jgi:hypothetical protein